MIEPERHPFPDLVARVPLGGTRAAVRWQVRRVFRLMGFAVLNGTGAGWTLVDVSIGRSKQLTAPLPLEHALGDGHQLLFPAIEVGGFISVELERAEPADCDLRLMLCGVWA